jgi:hypothetical protein
MAVELFYGQPFWLAIKAEEQPDAPLKKKGAAHKQTNVLDFWVRIRGNAMQRFGCKKLGWLVKIL